MIEIGSKAYGRISVEDRQVIHFPVGLYGFESLHGYALLDSDQPPFYWLQSIEDPDIAFVLVNPYVIRRDYVLDVSESDLEDIGNPVPEDLLVFAIVTVPEERQKTSCNLQGPIIINRRTRLGRQAISLDPRWRTKHYVLEELSATG